MADTYIRMNSLLENVRLPEYIDIVNKHDLYQ